MAAPLALLCCACAAVLASPPAAGFTVQGDDLETASGSGVGVALGEHPEQGLTDILPPGTGGESSGDPEEELSGSGRRLEAGGTAPAQQSGHSEEAAPAAGSPESAVSWDMTLDALLDAVGTSADATVGGRLDRLAARVDVIAANVQRCSQLVAHTSEDAQQLLAGQQAVQQAVRQTQAGCQARGSSLSALQTGQTRLQDDVVELKNGQTQLQSAQAELQTSQTQLKTGQIELKADVAQLKTSVQSLLTDVPALKSGQQRLLALLETVQQRVVTSLQAVTDPSVCPSGWSRHINTCFLIPPEQTTWYRAHRACTLIDRRAQLASVHADTAQHVFNMFHNSDATYIWIGLAREAGTPGWGWSDGSQFDFAKWRPGEPNNSGGTENCGHGYGGTTHGKTGWNDRICSASSAFLCQITLK